MGDKRINNGSDRGGCENDEKWERRQYADLVLYGTSEEFLRRLVQGSGWVHKRRGQKVNVDKIRLILVAEEFEMLIYAGC